MNRPPFLFNDLKEAFDGNPLGFLATAFYFSFASRKAGLKVACQHLLELEEQGETGAASAMADIVSGLEKTTDQEYLWISRKLISPKDGL